MTPNRGISQPVRASSGTGVMVPAVILPADPGYDLTPVDDTQPIPFTDSSRDIKPVTTPDYLLANPNLPVMRTTTYYPNGGGVATGPDRTPADVIPVVVTTTTVDPPMPTLPAPLVPITPNNNPYYVPGVITPVATPALSPHSPDPASNIVNGTPIQTPNLPAPSTSVALSVPAAPADTVNILGVQLSKTAVVIGALAVLFVMMNKK